MTESKEDLLQWVALPDSEWVAVHAPRFAKVRPHYVAYEEFLKAVLKQACRKLAPLAVVEARAKGIPSFAEKILRKRRIYVDPKDPLPPDPLVRITDLCGGRVITQTSDQVHAVCEFIERAFDIDWPNSEDVSGRLKPTEFGYRSVHYIVMVNPDKLKAAGITIPIPHELLEPQRLKAEIQVRTLLEHAWADIGHEMTYKTEFKVPQRIHREFAAVAAVLEGADREFGRLVQGLAAFRSNFGAYHTRKEVEEEIARLRIVLACEPTNLDLAVRTAQLALAIGQHETALDITKPYMDQHHQGVERVCGVALTEMHWDHAHDKEYTEGHASLEAACSHSTKDAETLCALAESWAHLGDDEKARTLFHQAVGVDSTEPVTISRYVEFEIAHVGNNAVINLVEPMIRHAIDRCCREIEARVNLPCAWSSLALLQLLIAQPFQALRAIAQVMRLCEVAPEATSTGTGTCCMPGRPCAAGRALLRLREALKRLRCIRKETAGFEWCERLVLLALATRVKDDEAIKDLARAASWNRDDKPGEPHLSRENNIVILAGGCDPEVQTAVEGFKPLLLKAAEDLSIIIISGGTRSGISGLAGDVAEQSRGHIRAFGYLPRSLPRGTQEDTNPARYAGSFQSECTDFTPLEPLQAWTDIIVAGADPHRVKLIGYAGGEISQCEYVISAALGARVAVVQDANLPKDRQFKDSGWEDCPNLVQIPMDRMSLRAFLLVDELPCTKPEFEEAAKRAHDEYVKSAIPKDSSLLPWSKLSEPLRVSNYHQIAYAENILKTVGLGLRPITDPKKPPLDMKATIGEDGIRRLAEMEHGRWNVERLLLGWRYAETKDVAKKLSPYLVAWDQLAAEIQAFDLKAIASLPASFREAELDVYKL